MRVPTLEHRHEIKHQRKNDATEALPDRIGTRPSSVEMWCYLDNESAYHSCFCTNSRTSSIDVTRIRAALWELTNEFNLE